MEKNYFVRKINIITSKTSELSFYDTEESAQKAFNKLCGENSEKMGQPFCSFWKNEEGIITCDYGSYVFYLQMGKVAK